MTDREFCIKLIRRLQDVDDTCSNCIYNPKNDYCTNIEVGDTETCYLGMKAFAEKEQGDDKQRMA